MMEKGGDCATCGSRFHSDSRKIKFQPPGNTVEDRVAQASPPGIFLSESGDRHFGRAGHLRTATKRQLRLCSTP